jgi:hypothetical protein
MSEKEDWDSLFRMFRVMAIERRATKCLRQVLETDKPYVRPPLAEVILTLEAVEPYEVEGAPNFGIADEEGIFRVAISERFFPSGLDLGQVIQLEWRRAVGRYRRPYL